MTRFDLNAAPALALDGVTIQFRSESARDLFAEHIEQGTPVPSIGTVTLITEDYEAAEGENVCARYGAQGIDFTLTVKPYGMQGVRFSIVTPEGRRRIVRTWGDVLDALGIEPQPEAPQSVVAECAARAECRPYSMDNLLRNPAWKFNCGFFDAFADINANRRPRTLDHAGDGLGPLPAFDPAYVAGYRAAFKLIEPGMTREFARSACGVARFAFIEAELPEFAEAHKAANAQGATI